MVHLSIQSAAVFGYDNLQYDCLSITVVQVFNTKTICSHGFETMVQLQNNERIQYAVLEKEWYK